MFSAVRLLVWLIVNFILSTGVGYLLIVSNRDSPGLVLFDAGISTHTGQPQRRYYMNVHKNAAFVHRLLYVDRHTGSVVLRQWLECDSFKYPRLFTLYIDSVSNGSLNYISFPLRILIQSCNEYEERFDGKEYHRTTNIRVSEVKKWFTETLASFAIPGPSSYDGFYIPTKQVCLRRSQQIASIGTSLLPLTVSQRCTVHYFEPDDPRLSVEAKGGDLVAASDFCVSTDPPWKVSLTIDYTCDVSDGLVSPASHNVKVFFKYQHESNDSFRVRRDLRHKVPTFERALYVASVPEEQPPGVSVCSVTARDPDGGIVTYSLVSLLDSRSQSMFGIDVNSGVVSTLTSVDRELLDVHYFRITATDSSFPPRSATTTLQVNVMDTNDHAPVFEATGSEYQASIRESVPAGSVVTTIRATDKDIGHNAEIEYSIASVDGGGLDPSQGTFSLDSHSGVLMTRTLLDRERTEIYTVVVTASDQALPPSERKSSSATIIIKVLDENDNYPQFVERTYTVGIPEDAPWNQSPVIATVKALDADEGQNAAIRYAIIGGNTQGQFSIDSQSGEVSLVKPLDYEVMRSYRIVIRAQDGGMPARSNTTQLLVNIKDVNDNPPRFYTTLFQEAVSENVPIGYSIVRVQAYDADEGENAVLTYSIGSRDWKGANTDDMPVTVDEKSGWIHTTRLLDRETHNKFQFQVLATDSGTPQKAATASIVITVQDVNDNDPVFSPKQYEVTVSEDDPPGTPVASVTATDADENPRLHYEITGGNVRGRFALTTQNGRGLITIAQPLDYKQEKRFILVVRATDSGGRFDTATVYVNVSDANNFAPVFDNAPYTASVYEDAPVGSTVLIVAATDGDVGENAEITYTLTSGLNGNTEFSINSQTGAITTTHVLDRETQAGYLLTVTARDNGNPALSDTTDIEISVTDVNDNAPVFLKPAYVGSVPEDAVVGTSVLQISATDADIDLNGRVRYTLSEGVEAFVIDPLSGVIRTAKPLDRESVAQYELEAFAIDRGSPPLSGTVIVTVRIEDVNDSPPAFESDKITLYIAENSPIGSTVGELYAKDPDEDENAVVQYSVIGGEDSDSFSLVRRPGSEKAELLTRVELDYESPHKRFELIVRAASPPLRSDVHVEILVTDVNDNAPKLKDFQIIFNNFRDCFPTGSFGRIPAYDADVSDKLHYRILSGNNANLVTLNETSGMLALSSQLNTNVPKVASMEVSVTDGVNEVKATMQLSVRLVTDDMLLNSVTVRLADMTEEAFLSPLLSFFVEGLAAIIPCPKDNVYIFSIQDDTDVTSRILNVSFSARRPDGQFYSPQYLQERVYLNRAILARLATVQVLPFDDNLCVREPCLNFEQCLTVLKFGNASGFISSDTVLFRPIYPVSTFACRCPEGFTGSREHYLCDTEVNLCYSNPCGNYGVCHTREGGYTCVCNTGYTGKNCEIDLSLDTCQPGICHSGSTCSPLVKGGFVCDDCAPDGTFEHYDRLCQLRGRGFPKDSFLTFPALKQRHRVHISLKFVTLADYGLLLYNGRYNEQHDFIALEIVDGGEGVQFSFSLGSDVTRVVAKHNKGVSDGQWHTVTVDYFNKSATVSLDDCDTQLTIKHGNRLGQACANHSTQILENRCAVLTETCHRFLDLTGPLQIGGLPALPASTSFQVHSKDFVGCIADVHIDHELLDLNSFVADNGTVVGCPERKSFCVSTPCQNGGTCTDNWGTFHCECPDGWSGKDCSQAIRPAWRFHGDSMLSFNPLLRPIQLPWLTALSIRTLQITGFLMSVQIGQNSSAVLSLDNGYIVYHLDDQSASLNTVRVNNGKWHRVEVQWTVSGITLSVDYGLRSATRTLNAKLQGLYVGKITIGIPENENEKAVGFVGCIQDVRVGTTQTILQRATVKLRVTEGCSNEDPCVSSTCPQHSQCQPDWEKYNCQCHTGYVGSHCTSICQLNPCENQGVCLQDKGSLKGYFCQCNSSLYSGEYCETEVEQSCPVSWWGHPVCGPCNCPTDKGYSPECNKTTGACSCKENHYLPEGSDRCLPCDCYSVGSFSRECDSITGQCKCKNGVIGRACDSCPNPYAEVTMKGCEVVYDGCPRNFAGGIWWPRTLFGHEAVENCPVGSQGKSSRLCDSILGEWMEPDTFNCTSDDIMNLRRLLGQLETGDVGITTFVAVESSNSLSRAVNTTNHLYGADILITQQILDRLLNYEVSQSGLNLTHSQDKDYIQNIVAAASAILTADNSMLWNHVQELTAESPETLVASITKYLETLSVSQYDTYTDPFETVSPNMVLGLDVITPESLFGYETEGISRDTSPGASGHEEEKVVLPDTSSILQPGIEYTSLLGVPKVSVLSPTVVIPKYNNYLQNPNKFDPYSQILIPIELLGIKLIEHGETSVKWTPSRGAVVGYAEYHSVGAVLPLRYDETVLTRWGVDIMVGSPVITVTATRASKGLIENESRILADTVPLPSPIRLRIWLDKAAQTPRINPQCVHWSTRRGGEWSRGGCHTDLPDDAEWWKQSPVSPPLLINCTCNQFSTFAVLVDVVGDEYIMETTESEDIAVWIGFSLSLWALTMATLILSLLRANTNSSIVYTNQAFCLLLAETLYLIATKARSSLLANEVACKLMAMALHYLWLSALSWWLVGSLHLYRMLTEIRDVNHGPMRFYYCVGYSLPAVVVGLAVGVRADQYGNVFFCWLSLYESVIWSLIGPAGVIVFLNLGVLIFALRAAFTLKDHVAGYGNLRTLLWLNVISLPMVAASWLLCLVSATEHSSILIYSMSAVVAVQAWFLLCGYCLGNARVRSGLLRGVMQLLGRKLPPLEEEDVPRPSSSQVCSQNPTRSALAYRNAGVSAAPGVSGFSAARRQMGISTSSTTSRSTTKTGSSPYRSDTQLRHTSTSTSNYDHSSDIACNFERPRTGNTQHTSDSESEVSVDGRSLELASSHSSDDEDSSRNKNLAATQNPNYLPNIPPYGSGTSASRLHTVQPPPHLNVIANSELFKPIYAPRWPSQTYTTEHMVVEEGYIPHRWTNMSASTVSDNEMCRIEHKLVNTLSQDNYYGTRDHSGSEAEDKTADKYLFPYTAEEDHCGGYMRPYSNEMNQSSNMSPVHNTTPSPVMMHHDFACPDISETEKDTSETPV